MSDSWTFGGVAFVWLRQDASGHPAAATWQRQPRLVTRDLLDSGDADVARVGYTALRISGPVYVEAANASALEALNGTQGTLSDGSSSWTAVLSLEGLTALAPAGAGSSGVATFVRPRAGS